MQTFFSSFVCFFLPLLCLGLQQPQAGQCSETTFMLRGAKWSDALTDKLTRGTEKGGCFVRTGARRVCKGSVLLEAGQNGPILPACCPACASSQGQQAVGRGPDDLDPECRFGNGEIAKQRASMNAQSHARAILASPKKYAMYIGGLLSLEYMICQPRAGVSLPYILEYKCFLLHHRSGVCSVAYPRATMECTPGGEWRRHGIQIEANLR